jgi:hypothetical protein
LPLRTCDPGEFEALLTKLMLPGEFPAVCGAKVTVKEIPCLAGTTAGKLIPLTEYPSPLHAADDTVTLALVAVRVPGNTLLAPTGTLPKFMDGGNTASCALPAVTDFVVVPVPPPQPTKSAVVRPSNRR